MKVILEECDADFDNDGGWASYHCDELNGCGVIVRIFNGEIETEYNPGSWEGDGTIYGGGWYESPGEEITDVDGDYEVAFFNENGEDITDEEAARLNPQLSEERLQDIKSTAVGYAFSDWEDWCREHYYS